MAYPDTPPPSFRDSISKYLLGFFGFIAAFFLLPRTLKFMLRRFALGLVAEVVTVVLAGLLTEKAIEQLSRDE